jgi:hypothetical protein
MAESKVRLYVMSVKTVTGTREIEREVVRTRARTIETEPTHDYILPGDQQKAAEMIRRIACKHGFEVEVVEVTRENVDIAERARRNKDFPNFDCELRRET